jgi:hypothetical protein
LHKATFQCILEFDAEWSSGSHQKECGIQYIKLQIQLMVKFI